MAPNAFVITLNAIGATARGWRGTMACTRESQPAVPLKLYDVEISPYCRLVRERLAELDLDVLILPCPGGGTRFGTEAKQLGGQPWRPLLVDDNNGETIGDWAAILDYLGMTYGHGETAPRGLSGSAAVASSYLSSLTMVHIDGPSGMSARPSKAPELPLELFSFESSPYSKPVRARLCELELPYLLRNTGKGHWKDVGTPVFRDKLWKGPLGTTPNRRWLAEKTGKVQVPYLIDPNTGVSMYESTDIIAYLDQTYGS